MSGIKFLLDTNMVIGLLKDSEPAINLNECQILLLDERIEAKATQLRRSGAFKLPDSIVAATAINHKLRLLTLDKGMIQGMQRLGYAY